VKAFSQDIYSSSKGAYQKILDENATYSSSLQMLVEYYGSTVEILHTELLGQYKGLVELVGDNTKDQSSGG